MAKWQIWRSGSAPETGTEGRACPAQLFAEVEADTFQYACDEYFKNLPLQWINSKQGRHYWHDYDPKELRYWGLKLYDNEADARKAWG